MTVFLRCFGLLFFLLAALPVRADVYGFIDEHGQPHLADKPLDSRYRLFKRGALPSGHGADPAEWRSHWEGRDIQAQKRLTPLIEHIARRHQLEPALLHALITVESGYRADAASPKGAQGLMQLMPDTAARFGLAASAVLEPRANLDAGARYLAWLLGLFQQRLDLALAAYNAGEGVVQRLGRIPPYEETERYVKAVRGIYLNQGGRLLADGRLRSSALKALAPPVLSAEQTTGPD